MKKLFISQSMQHATPEEVIRVRERIRSIVRDAYPDDTIELIDQYYVEDDPSWKDMDPRALRWARLGRSIILMGEADLIVFDDESLKGGAPGCNAEYTVAEAYHKEYPDRYQYTTVNELLKRQRVAQAEKAFQDNIVQCVLADIEKYVKYFNSVIEIVAKHLNINFSEFNVNDDENEWFLEYKTDEILIYASLNKDVVSGDVDFDYDNPLNPGLFTFDVCEHTCQKEYKPEIVISSCSEGLFIEYDIFNNEDKYYELFKELYDFCKYKKKPSDANANQ